MFATDVILMDRSLFEAVISPSLHPVVFMQRAIPSLQRQTFLSRLATLSFSARINPASDTSKTDQHLPPYDRQLARLSLHVSATLSTDARSEHFTCDNESELRE